MCKMYRCARCRKRPEELPEYIAAAAEYYPGCTPTEYVMAEEGTLDPQTGLFLCDKCYTVLGSPTNGLAGIHAVEDEPFWEKN